MTTPVWRRATSYQVTDSHPGVVHDPPVLSPKWFIIMMSVYSVTVEAKWVEEGAYMYTTQFNARVLKEERTYSSGSSSHNSVILKIILTHKCYTYTTQNTKHKTLKAHNNYIVI